MKKRIMVINREIEDAYVNKIKKIIPDWEVVMGEDPELMQAQLREAEIILHWKQAIEPDMLQNKQLKWLQTWSAGVNSLPMDTLKEKQVMITSANGVHAYPITETIFALLLGFTRKIHTYVRQQLDKNWNNAGIEEEIHEKTIGIVGAGAIGMETAKIAKAFGMRVLGVRYSGKAAEDVDQMYTPEQLEEVLPQCDAVVVTLPLTKATENMFTAREFRLMKESAFFINIGRGLIVNEGDLVDALKQKQIAGAGLDVFATEPLPADSPLWEMDNVIVTPHTSGATAYYEQRVIEDIFLPNLRHYIAGERPNKNLVNYEKGY